jgi:hypothetical protein
LFSEEGVVVIVRKIFLAALILVAIFASTGIVSANLLDNGGFEQPEIGPNWQILYSVPGWNLVTGEIEYQLENTVGLKPYEGTQYAELDPTKNVVISQIIGVGEGKTYDITFAQACRAGDPALPSILGVYTGTQLLGQTSCTAASQRDQAWVVHSYSFTAIQDGEVTITFADEGTSDSYGVLLDDVTVDESAKPVPEFPSFLMPVTFIAGLLAVVLLIRKNTG